jgi:hypothetical protein
MKRMIVQFIMLVVFSPFAISQTNSVSKLQLSMDTLANLYVLNEFGFSLVNVEELEFEMPVLLERIKVAKDGKFIARVLEMQKNNSCQRKELYAICQTNEEIKLLTLDYCDELLQQHFGRRKMKRLMQRKPENE